MIFNLSKQEVSAINSKHLHTVDKLYRINAGVGSDLLSVKNDTMVLEVNINDQWLEKKTLEQTSNQFLTCWKKFNSVLQKSRYYTVYVYNTSPLGFMISANATKEEMALALQKFNTKTSKRLLGVFSNKELNNLSPENLK